MLQQLNLSLIFLFFNFLGGSVIGSSLKNHTKLVSLFFNLSQF